MDKEPTKEQFLTYQKLFDFLNKSLFDSDLQNVLLNLSRGRSKRVAGTFYPFKWQYENNEQRHEISISPFITSLSKEQIIQTLVHEMSHLWQELKGKPSKNGYHNKEWSKKMESLGLIPSSTGKEGGKKTGYSMSDYIEPNGLLEKVIQQIPKDLLLPLTSIDYIKTINIEELPEEVKIKLLEQEKKSKMKIKVVYKCPVCNLKIWGKKGLDLKCNSCETNLESNQ